MDATIRNTGDEVWAITGASGRIGTVLRQAMLPEVAHLVLIDVVPPQQLDARERAPHAELGDPASLRAALQGVDGVVHLAAVPDEADFHDLVEANVIGTYHLLEAARQAGVRRVLLASTGRVIGMYDVGERVDVTKPTRPDGLYAVTKTTVEQLGRLYAEKFGLEVVALRIGAFKARPAEARDLSIWVSHADAARAFLAAMRHEPITFETMFAYSDNRDGSVDLEAGRRLGFEPLDDAAVHREEIPGRPGPVTSGPMGGDLASPEFTLSKQRPF
ncbi:NAD-dependent epimerase/dehydratase family protein [Agromyces ramosus]|uniref:Uronate dehydrogenase n=1 Tax=Agromyces ramosus TaxID=33879 RepID=A0ABU0RBS3_9MICO|nr:NAD(P)-dependent oxidoreductase [Agromyces ramosus]MDQ0895508.1 uronate dehydrogenase [Agromyces ramosus]